MSVTKCEALSDKVAVHGRESTSLQLVCTSCCSCCDKYANNGVIVPSLSPVFAHTLLPQSHDTALGSSCTAVQRSLANLVDQSVQGAAGQWTKEVKGLANTTEKFGSSQDTLLKGVVSAVDQYVSEEVKRDIPTGTRNELPLL